MAAENVSTVQTTAPAPARAWGFQLVFEPSSALKQTSDPTYSAGADIHFIPSYALTPKWKLATLWTITQAWTGDRSTQLTRSEVRGTWSGMPLSRGLTFAGYGSLFLPLSHGKRSEESYFGGLRAAPKLAFDFAAVSRVPLSVEYELAFTKSAHEFTTSVSGAGNVSFSLSQRGLVAWDLGKGWSLSSQLAYYSYWDYFSEVTNKFKWDQEVGFVPNPQWSLALGLSNYANGMRVNGQDSNLAIFDYETTVIYATIALSI